MADNAFTVDPHALNALARTLVVLSARLDEARATTGGIDASGFGDQDLAVASRHFLDHWKWGTDRLSISLTDTADILTKAALQYREVEDVQQTAQGQTAGH